MPTKDEILQQLNASDEPAAAPSKRDAIRASLDASPDLINPFNEFLVKPVVQAGKAIAQIPGLTAKAEQQPLTPEETNQLQEGAATLGSFGTGLAGEAAGGILGGVFGGPPGAVAGAIIGGGLGAGGGYEAMKVKRHDPRPLAQRVKDTTLAGLFGVGTNVLFAGLGKMLFGKRTLKVVPADPAPELPAALTEVPADQPKVEVLASRMNTHGSSLDPDAVVRHAPDLEATGEAMMEGDRVDFSKANQVEPIIDATRNSIWDAQGEEEFRRFMAGQRAHEMKKLFSDAEQEDMTFYRERTRNPYVENDTPEGPVARLSPEAKQAVAEGAQTMDNIRDTIAKSPFGQDIGFYQDYILHSWKPPSGMTDAETRRIAAKWASGAAFQNKRTFETYVQGIEEAGFVPRTTRFPELVQLYENMGARVIAQNRLLDRLNNTISPEGIPLLIPHGEVPGAVTSEIPKHYETLRIGNKSVSVHPDVADELRPLLERPFSGKWIRRMETVNAYLKKTQLSISAFHHFALGETTFGMGFYNPRYLMPDAPIQAMRVGGKLLRDPEFVQDATRDGLTMAIPSDVQVTKVRNLLMDVESATRKTPIGGATKMVRQANDMWDDALWTFEHNRMKATMYYELKNYYLKRYPEMGSRDIGRGVAEVVNNTLGGQNWERSVNKFVRSPRGRQILHWVLLAPDWTISQLKVGRTAIWSKNPIIRDASRRSLASHALALYFYGNMTNLALTGLAGHPHFLWQNDPDHKLDVELPWKDKTGAKLYISPAKAVKELYRWVDPSHFFESGREQLGNKLATIPREVLQQLSGYSLGGFPAPYNPQRMEIQGERPTMVNQAVERGKEIAAMGLPFSVRSDVKFSPWPVSKGTTKWKTVQAFQEAIEDNSPERIAHIAQVAKENGIDDVTGLFNVAKSNVDRRKRKALHNAHTK